MSEQTPQTETKLPDQLLASRVVGQFPAEKLPWLEEQNAGVGVNVSELTFSDGRIFVASAVSPRLSKIAEIARSQDPKLEEGEQYTRSDMMLMTAAHLEANGQAIQSKHIAGVRGDISTSYDTVRLKAYKEGLKANTRRLYYGLTNLDRVGFKPRVNDIDRQGGSLLVVRLALTDKNNQVKTLYQLTGQSVNTLKANGAGK